MPVEGTLSSARGAVSAVIVTLLGSGAELLNILQPFHSRVFGLSPQEVRSTALGRHKHKAKHHPSLMGAGSVLAHAGVLVHSLRGHMKAA